MHSSVDLHIRQRSAQSICSAFITSLLNNACFVLTLCGELSLRRQQAGICQELVSSVFSNATLSAVLSVFLFFSSFRYSSDAPRQLVFFQPAFSAGPVIWPSLGSKRRAGHVRLLAQQECCFSCRLNPCPPHSSRARVELRTGRLDRKSVV